LLDLRSDWSLSWSVATEADIPHDVSTTDTAVFSA